MKKDKLDPELITAVYESFRNQRRILNELNTKLSKASDREEWISLYLQRSETTKVAFGVNNETGALFSDVLFSDSKLKYDYAEVFFHEELEDVSEGLIDIFWSCHTLNRLAEYYRNQHDLLRLIPILDKLGNRYLSTVKMYFKTNYSKALNCFKEILSYKTNYSLIPDLNIRKLFFEAYYNLCCVIPLIESPDTISASASLDFLLDALTFYNSDTVKKIDGNSPEIRLCIDKIKENWLWIEYRIDTADPETQSAFLSLAHDVYDSSLRQSGNDIFNIPISTLLSYQHALILEGNTSYIDTVNYMMDYYYKKHAMNAAAFAENGFNIDDFYFETRIPISLIKWLDKIDILSEMCSSMKKRLLNDVNSYFKSLSENGVFSHIIYESVCEWCFFAVKYIESREEKEQFIINMLINREPQTFFNAHLSERLAELITESIYSLKPILLNSVETYLKSLQRRGDRDDVMDFIKKCALFHDIGINRLSRLESMEFRTLNDEEKNVLRCHVNLGAEIFTGILEPYHDAVIGHHKYYDQSQGYPENLDLSNSPIRIVCDLLSICDALNSGTDYIGRCYKEPKDFSIILSELITYSGTRYNTNLVNLFLDDMNLSCMVDNLICRNREKSYYDYYVKYFDK